MDYIGERMAVQNSMKIRREGQTASNLSQTSEEDFGVGHLRGWREILWVSGVANDCVGRAPAQQKRRGWQARCADYNVGLRGELLEIGREFHLNSVGLQLRCEPEQPLRIACA